MEKNTLQQKFEIAKFEFPIGTKVCNYKIGTIGTVSDKPFVDLSLQKIFVSVIYDDLNFHEDVEQIFAVKTVKKGSVKR